MSVWEAVQSGKGRFVRLVGSDHLLDNKSAAEALNELEEKVDELEGQLKWFEKRCDWYNDQLMQAGK